MVKSIKYDVSEFNLIKYYMLPEVYNEKKKQCYSICTRKNNKDEYYVFLHTNIKSNKTSKLIYRFMSEESSNNFIISEIENMFKKHELIGKMFIYDEHDGYIKPRIINKNKIVIKKTKRLKTNITGHITGFDVVCGNVGSEYSSIDFISNFHKFIKIPKKEIGSIKVSDINSRIYTVNMIVTPKLINSFNEEVDILSIKKITILDEKNLKKFLEVENIIKKHEQNIENIKKKIEKETRRRDTLTNNRNIINNYDRSLLRMPYGALIVGTSY